MARRFSSADAAACVAAGVGAWFTRASLDVFGGPGGDARVAMLPAPVEVPGLVAIAALAAFLLRTILGRRSRSPERTGSANAHLLLPLVALVAMAIPYAPWIADAVPAWRALAGPARLALWALVCGQIAWIGIDVAAPPAEHRHRPLNRYWPALAVFVVSLAAAAITAGVIAPDALDAIDASSEAGRTAAGLRLSLVAIVSTLMWLWAERAAADRRVAVLAWLAIAGAAPFLIAGLFMPLQLTGAACVVVAAGWPGGADDSRPWTAAVRGSALAALAWMDVAYVPLAIVLAACAAWRMRHGRLSIVAAGAPLLLVAAGAAAANPHGWTMPFGPPGAALWSAAASLMGQQDGLLLSAPATALALPGLWWLWRDGGASRVAAVEGIGGMAAALLTAGWHNPAGRALAIPGAALTPALPLLVVPIARWLRQSGPTISQVALARLLVLWGILLTAALALARGGATLVRGRDGVSGLLDWLAPSRDLVRVAPLASPVGSDAITFTVAALIWMGVAAAFGWLASRARPSSQGAAAAAVTIAALVSLTVGALVVGSTLGPRLPTRVSPELRAAAQLLDGFDARRRPVAVAYDRLRLVSATDVPALFSFDATPGARRYPQPLRVLLNTRLSLPAGDYSLTVYPRSGVALSGPAGLQVGRMGPPMRDWEIAAATGAPWTAGFTLPVDASFVGLRTTPEFETRVAALRVQPVRIVNGRDRPDLPAVLSSATYRNVMVTFHGDQVYAERDGFWVRGRSTLLATFAPPAPRDVDRGVRLSLHGGPAPTHVRFETTTWSTTLALEPGISRELRVPRLQGQTLLPVRITPDNGFVPADAHGGSDRRLLGCWIEVLE